MVDPIEVRVNKFCKYVREDLEQEGVDIRTFVENSMLIIRLVWYRKDTVQGERAGLQYSVTLREIQHCVSLKELSHFVCKNIRSRIARAKEHGRFQEAVQESEGEKGSSKEEGQKAGEDVGRRSQDVEGSQGQVEEL